MSSNRRITKLKFPLKQPTLYPRCSDSIGKRSTRLFSTTSSSTTNFQILNIYDVDGTCKKLHYIDVGPFQTPSIKLENDTLPLVLLAGTAQSISTYMPHIKQLAKTRRVIMPELRCQGTVTDLDPNHANMEQYVKDVVSVLQALGLYGIKACNGTLAAVVDMIGFSFGGRVSLAVAANFPHLISHLSITGVPYVRPSSGNAIINEWKLLLSQKQYYACAESFLINGYHAAFLDKHRNKLNVYADIILANNNMSNLYQLLLFSHYNNTNTNRTNSALLATGYDLRLKLSEDNITTDKATNLYISDVALDKSVISLFPDDSVYNKDIFIPVSIDFCVQNIQCKTQVIAGLYDKIAGYDEVLELAQKIQNASFFEMETGHLAPFEDPILWRKLVLQFLNS